MVSTLHRAIRKPAFVPFNPLLARWTVDFLPSLQSGKLRHRSTGTHESTKTTDRTPNKYIDGFVYGQSGLPVVLEGIISSRRPPGGIDWCTLVDQYLPPNLRVAAENAPGSQPSLTSVRPIDTLPQILAKARQQSKIDLLSYVGVYQGRWEAVLWLVKAMMEQEQYTGSQKTRKQSEAFFNMLLPNNGETLDELTNIPVQVESPGISRISLASVMNVEEDGSSDAGLSLRHQTLAQIWQSLGTMILQAADRSPDDPKYTLIMTQVFRILGHLHRIDAFPDPIYNYAFPTDPNVLQRPPTLHLLSKRIMSTLSDVEFDLHWKQEILKYQQQGYELSETGLTPRIREFGPELWLDLILWACVEGGWISEGAWIIGEMERRKASRETQWSVISWQEICAQKTPNLNWISILRLEIDRTRLNQTGSIGIATGSDSTVDMGTRTISREVVLAILDGLLNIHAVGHDINLVNTQQRVICCKQLLERGRSSLDPDCLDAMIVRIIQAAGLDERGTPGVLQRILDIRPVTADTSPTKSSPHSGQDADADDTAAILGLRYRNLRDFAEQGNIQGSLTAFQKIQATVDAKRDQRLKEFASELNMRLGKKDELQDLMGTAKTEHAITFMPQIPVPTLVAFLDLISESKLDDLGKWLLYNEDLDGSVIDPELYGDLNLQPALLRFATATADEGLLARVVAKIETPISPPVLHALLRCQVIMGKWPTVERLFEYIQDTRGTSWSDTDAMTVAAAILRLEHGPPDSQTKEQLSNARRLLINLLQGKYNSPQDPSEPVDLSETKLANQLGRIFKTLPGSLSTLVTDRPRNINRAHTSVYIRSYAFNILLEAVIDISGQPAGKALWERWCCEPRESSPKSSSHVDHHGEHARVWKESKVKSTSEKIMMPTRSMLRNILRPILLKRQRASPTKTTNQEDTKTPISETHETTTKTHSSSIKDTVQSNPDSEFINRPLTQEETEILYWGIDMFKKFGLSAKEITNEIPGAIPRSLREKIAS